MNIEGKAIILFDGICNLCNKWVVFVLKRDKKDHFRFAPLQSQTASQLLTQYHIPIKQVPESIVLIESNKATHSSSAIINIVSQLGGLWKLVKVLKIIPERLRNSIYRWIAKNRYRIFGQKDSCMIPSPKWENKFLDQQADKTNTL